MEYLNVILYEDDLNAKNFGCVKILWRPYWDEFTIPQRHIRICDHVRTLRVER